MNNMITNPKWFELQDTGWVKPKTWQAWVYIAGILLFQILIYTIELPSFSWTTRIIFDCVLFLVVCIDILQVKSKINNDERDFIHEAIAQRNSSWFMLVTIIIALNYQLISSLIDGKFSYDPWLVIALSGACLVRLISQWYLKDK
jgi:hypothetical protein